MGTPNVGADPINPAYYAGTACAEIIEYMPTNVGFAFKYAWRLGEKDAEEQEAGKAVWYLEREIVRLKFFPDAPNGFKEFAEKRIKDAKHSGKLNNWQYHILMQLLQYVLNQNVIYLNNAILSFNQKVINGTNNQ